MKVTVYGLASCSTVKKALVWLDEHGIAYDFHDFKTEGASKTLLKGWCRARGWEKVMNRGSLTYRNLPEAAKTDLDEAKAIALMAEKPTLIRRPVIVGKDILLQGFAGKRYAETFGAAD